LLIVLVASAGLRIALATRGGQSYWPDEIRYHVVRDAVASFAAGDRAEFVERILGTSDHILFRVVALVPAVTERLLFPIGQPPPTFAAAYFGLFGAGAIFLAWLIVRRVSGNETAASWTALFYAMSGSAFLYARHYFPYDAGLFFLLLGWWWGARADRALQLWAAGAWVGTGYLVYNAYWNVGGIILMFLTLRAPLTWLVMLRRSVLLASGLLSPVIATYGLAAGLGFNLLVHAREFSQTIVQGDFGEAWLFIPSYFAATDGAYPLLLIGVIIFGAVVAFRRREPIPGAIWVIMGAALAAQMILLSDVVHRFALAGRMVRPLMLFLAMGAGAAAARGLLQCSRFWSVGLAVVALLVAAPGLFAPLQVMFPEEFRRQSERLVTAEVQRNPNVSLRQYFVGFMHWPEFFPQLPPHVELLRAPHPHEYRPYLFEGYPKHVRAKFMSHDVSMRLVRLLGTSDWRATAGGPQAEWAPHPGVLELHLKLPDPRPIGRVEPLVVSGETGRGDLISLRYIDETQVQIIADHWGWGEWRSAPFGVPPQPEHVHRVVVASPALIPPGDHRFMQEYPEFRALADRLVVEWNSETVACTSFPGFLATTERVYLGENAIGGSTAEPNFSGEILKARRVDPRGAAHAGWGIPSLPARIPGEWAGKPGPQEATFNWPPGIAAGTELTVFAMSRALDEVVVTARAVTGGVDFGLWVSHSLWQPHRLIARSAPRALTPGAHRFWFSNPWLTPSPDEVSPRESLRARWLGARTIVALDGMVLFNQRLDHQGIEMAETLHGEPLAPLIFAWGSDWPLRERNKWLNRRIAFTETGWVDLDVGTPIVGVFAAQVAPGWSDEGFVLPLRLRLRLPAGGARLSEPLLVSGRTGAADGVFIVYENEETVRLGHDHWGSPLVVSESLRVNRDVEHTIEISLVESQPPLHGQRQGTLQVSLNGAPVLVARDRAFYDSAPGEFSIAHNLIGMGTAVEAFSGEIVEVGRPKIQVREQHATRRTAAE
jgi:hypothetical protein